MFSAKKKTDKESVVLDQTQQNQPAKPARIDAMAKLMSENIRSFLIIVLLCLLSLVSILFAWKESTRADNNIKVAWVKLMPNGTWDIEFHDEDRQPEFFQSTIDYILTQWVERRYSEIPHSIQSDYGYAYNFMSPKLRQEFISPKGLNAPARAAEVSACSACKEVRFKVRSDPDHYDSDKTKFGQHDGTLYRTNVFVLKNTYGADGSPQGDPEKLIVSLQWRIKSKEEIQADKDLLKQNPIGLEITAYDLLKDVS